MEVNLMFSMIINLFCKLRNFHKYGAGINTWVMSCSLIPSLSIVGQSLYIDSGLTCKNSQSQFSQVTNVLIWCSLGWI